MRKLTLEMDRLVVESFETAEPDAPREGTVRAHEVLATQPRELCKTILTYCPCTPFVGG